jgi:hypothetical protein
MATKSRGAHENDKPPAGKPRRPRLTQAEEDAILGRLIQESREEAEREGYASMDDVRAILRGGGEQAADGC